MQHWRTTLIGIGLAALNGYAHGFSWQTAAISAGIAGLGLIANDPPWMGGPPLSPPTK